MKHIIIESKDDIWQHEVRNFKYDKEKYALVIDKKIAIIFNKSSSEVIANFTKSLENQSLYVEVIDCGFRQFGLNYKRIFHVEKYKLSV